MSKKLNPRQNAFVNHLAAGNNATKAATLAGYSKHSARFTGSNLLTNPNIKQHLEELFDHVGLTDEKLILRLKQTIDSGVGVKATNSDALKGLRTILELKDYFPSPRQKIDISQTNQIALTLQGKSVEEMVASLQEITEKTQHYISKLKEKKPQSSRPL